MLGELFDLIDEVKQIVKLYRSKLLASTGPNQVFGNQRAGGKVQGDMGEKYDAQTKPTNRSTKIPEGLSFYHILISVYESHFFYDEINNLFRNTSSRHCETMTKEGKSLIAKGTEFLFDFSRLYIHFHFASWLALML